MWCRKFEFQLPWAIIAYFPLLFSCLPPYVLRKCKPGWRKPSYRNTFKFGDLVWTAPASSCPCAKRPHCLGDFLRGVCPGAQGKYPGLGYGPAVRSLHAGACSGGGAASITFLFHGLGLDVSSGAGRIGLSAAAVGCGPDGRGAMIAVESPAVFERRAVKSCARAAKNRFLAVQWPQPGRGTIGYRVIQGALEILPEVAGGISAAGFGSRARRRLGSGDCRGRGSTAAG